MIKNILEVLFICLMITLIVLTTLDLFANEQCYNHYPTPEIKIEKKLLELDELLQAVSYILRVNMDVIYTVKTAEAFVDSYHRTGLSLKEFMSICAGESRFKQYAIGRVNPDDKGVCQINKDTWKWFKEKGWIEGEWKNIFDIEYNVHVASVILMKNRERLLKIYPNKTSKEINKLLIESYNKGVGGTKKIVRNEGKFDYYQYILKMMEI